MNFTTSFMKFSYVFIYGEVPFWM